MYINHQKKAIMIATDGSETSKDAFLQAIDFITDDYHLYIGHISDTKKSYLPLEFKTTYIWEDYKNECLSRFASKKYDLVFEEKNEESNIRDQLLLMAKALNVNYLFIGFSGRKGKKLDVSLMGQTVKYSIYNATIPVVIIKYLYKRSEKENGGFNFLVCVDGSEKSYKALESALDLSISLADNIYICSAPINQGEQNIETIKIRFNEYTEKYKDKNLKYLPLPTSNDPSNAIIEFVNFNDKINIDFIIFGNNGYRAQLEGKSFIGRMAENLLTNVKANPIIIP